MRHTYPVFLLISLLMAACSQAPDWSESPLVGDIRVIEVPGAPVLGYSTRSGVQLLEVEGLPFKDLNRNGQLDPYEDWRRPVAERASDLASRLSPEEIAGLMLYSRHQAIPADTAGYRAGTYSGKPFHEADTVPYALTDQQRAFLVEDHLRHVLITSVENPEVAVRWNNAMQALVEGMGHGIPANNSSDPRNGARSDAEYNAGSGGAISLWPEEIGLAATFDPEITFRFGAIASQEYRALGIATALSPQVDLATDPRWNRFYGTFGGDPRLATDMARAYVDGFQGSGTALDWGPQSVNAMVKHWPGGGSGEGGRDAHFAYGKFAVYPGGNFQDHLKPFIEGAFKLEGKTGAASAVMPYYTISLGQDTLYGEDVGNGFSKYLVTDLLRKTYGYQGVVCTDWLITGDEGPRPDVFAGKPWGVETLSVAERHYKALEAGADQFGGNNDAGPVLEAFRMLSDTYGEEGMRTRIEASAVRLLTNIFQVGLFENPYLDPEASRAIVGQPDFMEAGYQAQLKSIVMLKNRNGVLPMAQGKTAYIPKRTIPAGINFFGQPTPQREEYPVERSLVEKHYRVTDKPGEADFAIVFIKSPVSNGYSRADREAGGNGYLPISLQLPDYTAANAREHSLGAGDPVTDPEITDRAYRGKTSRSNSYPDLQTLQDTRRAMGGKPVILVVTATNPMVFSDIEPGVDAILLDFGVQVGAMLDIVSGAVEPSGLLPMQMPADMATVEQQLEDVPHDMVPYVDTDGNPYDFAFGLNWKGVIKDERVAKYGRTPSK
jgi:beta-glucosidase